MDLQCATGQDLPLANMEFIQFHPSVFLTIPAQQMKVKEDFLSYRSSKGGRSNTQAKKGLQEDFVLNYHPLGSIKQQGYSNHGRRLQK